jgi:hypothetical protein
MFFKSAELAAEAIPCTVLQVFAMVFNGDWSSVPMFRSLSFSLSLFSVPLFIFSFLTLSLHLLLLLSLLISTLVTGMSSSMMSYIVDTSMISRANAGKERNSNFQTYKREARNRGIVHLTYTSICSYSSSLLFLLS